MEISVIVPVYKVEKYLKQCVDSILSQTFPHLEVILVDDGSPDGCPAICDDYALKDPRVRVFHQENHGLSCARNKGIEKSRGDWLCFVDSDDYLRDDMLENLYRTVTGNNADMAVCDYMLVDDEGHLLQGSHKPENSIFTPDMFFQKYISSTNTSYYTVIWNKLYRREIFQSLRFPVGLIHEDIYVLYDVITACQKIAMTDHVGYCYRQRSDSIMSAPRGVKNLSAPEGFLNHAERFAADRKWGFAVGFLLKAKSRLLMFDYGEGGKKSPEYLALKKRVWKAYRRVFPHLSFRQRLSMLLYFINEPLAEKLALKNSR